MYIVMQKQELGPNLGRTLECEARGEKRGFHRPPESHQLGIGNFLRKSHSFPATAFNAFLLSAVLPETWHLKRCSAEVRDKSSQSWS